jgi:hypothetical protein
LRIRGWGENFSGHPICPGCLLTDKGTGFGEEEDEGCSEEQRREEGEDSFSAPSADQPSKAYK